MTTRTPLRNRSFALLLSLLALPVSFLSVSAPGLDAQDSGDRLYGRVTTAAGGIYEGWIRWDKNEGSWADILNGSKEMPYENLREAEELGTKGETDRERSVEFLGIRVSWDEDSDDYPSSAESGIRFGHVRRLAVLDDDAAVLTLKSGEEVELSGGSTDLGTGVRGIEIDDPERGLVELRWRDLESVDFGPAPARSGEGPRASRIHGTLEDRWGNRFTGYIAWDLDEILTSDELDGDERGRKRAIRFADIAAIERAGSSSSRVTLSNGEEVRLSGSNDVNSSNRGIQVSDPGLGQVQVGWSSFGSLRLHPADRVADYDAFDGGHRLRGTVETEDGRTHSGWIRWDNDEEWSWELLDGDYRGVTFDVEFGNIERIEKRSTRSAEVVLRDGRTFELEGSNDVDRGNKGIFVRTDDGDSLVVSWRDFRALTFEGR